jgi:hypothetical protein
VLDQCWPPTLRQPALTPPLRLPVRVGEMVDVQPLAGCWLSERLRSCATGTREAILAAAVLPSRSCQTLPADPGAAQRQSVLGAQA